jgi:hypothetical protein
MIYALIPIGIAILLSVLSVAILAADSVTTEERENIE